MTHIQNFVDKLNAMDEGQKETILRIGMFVAALAPMLMGLGKVITFSANVSRALGTLSAGLVKAGGFSGVFTKALGLITSPAAIVVGAIAAITAVIIHLWNTNEDFRNTITAIWQKIKDAFTTFAAGISERLSALGITFSDVTSAIKQSGTDSVIYLHQCWKLLSIRLQSHYKQLSMSFLEYGMYFLLYSVATGLVRGKL